MGFFSKVAKGVKNIFSGVGKVVRSVFREVKRFVKSDVGKVLIAAAAIYLGGSAMDWWEGPFNTDAFGQTVSTIADTAPVTAPVTTPVTPDPTIPIPESTPIEVNQSTGKIVDTGSGNVINQGVTEQTTKNVAEEAVKKGTKFMDSPTDWMKENPVLTLGAGNLLSGALAPDPYEEQRKLLEWQRRNSNIAGINYDGSGGGVQTVSLIDRANQNPTYARGRNDGTG